MRVRCRAGAEKSVPGRERPTGWDGKAYRMSVREHTRPSLGSCKLFRNVLHGAQMEALLGDETWRAGVCGRGRATGL